jgi:hypothetical protein
VTLRQEGASRELRRAGSELLDARLAAIARLAGVLRHVPDDLPVGLTLVTLGASWRREA